MSPSSGRIETKAYMTRSACAEFTAPDPEVTGSRVKVKLESYARSADSDIDDVFEVVLDVLRRDFGCGSSGYDAG
jgi:hypothetical protein